MHYHINIACSFAAAVRFTHRPTTAVHVAVVIFTRARTARLGMSIAGVILHIHLMDSTRKLTITLPSWDDLPVALRKRLSCYPFAESRSSHIVWCWVGQVKRLSVIVNIEAKQRAQLRPTIQCATSVQPRSIPEYLATDRTGVGTFAAPTR